MAIEPVRTTPSCIDPADEAGLLHVDAALAHILDAVKPVAGRIQLPVRDALGRVLAADVISPLNVPAHTNSAMDGYAVRGADLAGETVCTLQLRGQALAGHPFSGRIGAGECVRITTGAPLPAGADTVVMQEQAERRGATVRIAPGQRVGQNVRQAGEDLARGQVALGRGARLRPADLGLLASLGRGEVDVLRPLRVAFFSTGDELRSVGQPLAAGEIYDSNRYTLFGMLRQLGIELLDLGVVGDTPEALRAAVRAAATADAVVSSGGVSVGDADYVRAVLEELGEVGFWKIAIKPGRPFAFGRVGSARYFGLPGNPVAVMVTFYMFLRPALLRMMGAAGPWSPPRFRVACSDRLRKKPGRTEFVRGVLECGPAGATVVRSTGRQGSGILRSMSEANCFIVLPHDAASTEPDQLLDVIPFEGLI